MYPTVLANLVGSNPAEPHLKAWAPGPYVRVLRADAHPQENDDAVATLLGYPGGHASGQVAVRVVGEVPALRVGVAGLRGTDGKAFGGRLRLRYPSYVSLEGGYPDMPDPLPAQLPTCALNNQAQPVWLTAEIPADTEPGVYMGAARFSASGCASAVVPIRLEVVGAPIPQRYSFYLDVWQHPASIAAHDSRPLWSPEHWRLIRAYARDLASRGQKPITACIIRDPWDSQTAVPHASMVEWRGDGERFTWDYSVLDRYVKTCTKEGLTGPVNCYSMVLGPGSRRDCVIWYTDSATGEERSAKIAVGEERFARVWSAFLRDFAQHMERMGWLGRTNIAFDERPPDVMEELFRLVKEHGGGLGTALAGEYSPWFSEVVDDYSVIAPGPPPDACDERRLRGRTTTFYVCCGPPRPNTFVHSPPIEARLLPWVAFARRADGLLRWAYQSWPTDPWRRPDHRYPDWPAGDTFLVYPGPRGPVSSIRWEMLRDGVQDYELFGMLERAALGRPTAEADAALSRVRQIGEEAAHGRIAEPKVVDAARRAAALALQAIVGA